MSAFSCSKGDSKKPTVSRKENAAPANRAARTVSFSPEAATAMPCKFSARPSLVPQLPRKDQALLEQSTRPRVVALTDRHKPQVCEREGDAVLVSQPPPDDQALLVQRPRRRIVALITRQIACPIECLAT